MERIPGSDRPAAIMTDLRGDLPILMPVTVSDHVAERAHALIEQGRVLLISTRPDWAIVTGWHGHYLVKAWTRGVSCTCPAGRRVDNPCCHSAAAMVAWADRDRVGELVAFPAEPGDQLDLLNLLPGAVTS